MPRRVIGVIGAGECDAEVAVRAEEVGRRLAEANVVVATGGLGGVMEAASRGASKAGGLVIGILPMSRPEVANAFVDVAVATGMGEARNAILVNTCSAFVAIAGGYGTLSEIAYALRQKKRVVALDSWDVDPAVVGVATPEEAVAKVLGAALRGE
ncbi:MAG: TIGR00725 family protein [Planctomycetota bacterium]|nr:MAG: TIGR00725 family protein [Planctomycetota bacterium]